MYRELCTSTDKILSQMVEIAKDLKEFSILTDMKGIGNNLASRFITEIGYIHRFNNASSLIAYVGIDAPAYQSGQFNSINRRSQNGVLKKRIRKQAKKSSKNSWIEQIYTYILRTCKRCLPLILIKKLRALFF